MRASLRMKRALVGTAVGAMVLGLMPASAAFAEIDPSEVCANADADVFPDGGATHGDALDCMAAYGVYSGLADGSAGTFDPITREQMASLLVKFALVANPGVADLVDLSLAADYDDVAETNVHATNIAIISALQITANTGKFYPKDPVTRGQMASFLVRAHEALGVTFPADATTAFNDIAGTTHEEAIIKLESVGLVAGVTATMYEPNANVARGATASLLARSAQVLQDNGLWDSLLPGAVLSFTVLDDTATGLGTLDTTSSRGDDDLSANDNLLALSDGNAVTVFQFSVPDDSFAIDGAAASPTAFLAALDVGDTLEATPNGDGSFAHNLVNESDLVLEGVVGNGSGDTGLGIVDAPSGVELTPLDAAVVLGETYTVDGASATQAEFLDNLNVGDYLEIEVLFEDEDVFADSVFRHNLTNQTLEGELAEHDMTSFTVDVNADDDGVVGGALPKFNAPGYTVADVPAALGTAGPDAVKLTVDGTAVAVADIAAVTAVVAFENGGMVEYSRVESDTASIDGDVTIVYASDMSDVVSMGVVLSEAGGVITFVTGSDFGAPLDTSVDPVGTITVDGVVVLPADLVDLLSAGDNVTHTLEFGEATGPLVITTANLAGDVDAIDAGADTLKLDVSDDESIAALDYTAAPDGYTGGVTYYVDGGIVNVAAFETAIADAITAESAVALEVVESGSTVQFRATIG